MTAGPLPVILVPTRNSGQYLVKRKLFRASLRVSEARLGAKKSDELFESLKLGGQKEWHRMFKLLQIADINAELGHTTS